MCRWITLISEEKVTIADLVLKAENSLVKMSFNAGYHPGFGPTNNSLFNGDGFGVGWYHDCGPNPAIFRDVFPAWGDSNLKEVCMATRSDCVVAHVRAASPGSVVSRENCHPFKCGRLLFCHNGRIDGFWSMRKVMLNEMTDGAYTYVKGTTDSEVAFGMILAELDRDGEGSPFTQKTPFGHDRLARALRKCIEKIGHYQRTLDIPKDKCRGFSTLNFSLTDGETLVVSRFCDQDPVIPAPSLYFAYGKAKELHAGIANVGECPSSNQGPGDGSETGKALPATPATRAQHSEKVQQLMTRTTPFRDYNGFHAEWQNKEIKDMAFCVSSDPLTFCDMWIPLPANSIMWYTKGGAAPELLMLEKPSVLVAEQETQ